VTELLAMMYVNWTLRSSHALSEQNMIGKTFTQNMATVVVNRVAQKFSHMHWGGLNFLCGVGNCSKIWSASGQHKIQYTG